MRRSLVLSLISIALSLPLVAQGRNAGIRAGKLDVQVTIVEGIATTQLTQTLTNTTRRPGEADWILPLPAGAVADRFEMTSNGTTLKGEVLEADAARRAYEAIVRRRRDPGLLEYFDRGLLRVHVFPIPPGGQTEVVVRFRHILQETEGVTAWKLALNGAGLEGVPAAEVALDMRVQSKRTLANVFSPHPAFDILRKGDHEARISFEGRREDLGDGEVSVHFGYSEREFGLNLLTHRAKEGEQGTYALLLSPRRTEAEKRALQKSMLFVLDTSGSMSGEKIQQARGAIRYFLHSLNEGDRFNVVPFATEPVPFFERPVPATPDNLIEAFSRIDAIRARGGTNIAGALAVGLAHDVGEAGRVPITIFLTDGLPSVGERDTELLLDVVRGRRRAETRLFVFGVGPDVNTALLDGCVEETGGRRYYVGAGEDIEVKTSALFHKLSHPVLTELELEVEGIELTAQVPRLGNLYVGEEVHLFGRFEGGGEATLRLRGKAGGEVREFEYVASFPKEVARAHDFLPVLWAERRVGQLLDELRLQGHSQELVDEVVRLGIEYNIVTAYTSHLILEEGVRVAQLPGVAPGGGRPRMGDPGLPPGAPLSLGSARGKTYRGPGNTGPSSGPAASGPAHPGSSGFFLGRGTKSISSTPNTHRWLIQLGVLPADASPEELAELARRIAHELRRSRERLDGLGKQVTGEGAVADSRYLDQLAREGIRSKNDDWMRLFSRRVGSKVFSLRAGVWTDRSYDPTRMKEKRTIEAYSPEFFSLLKRKPGLKSYVALSARLLVVFEGEVLELVPAPKPTAEPPAGDV